MFTIKSPNENLSGLNRSVEFRNGTGYTDDPTLAEKFRQKGYEVTDGGKAYEPGLPDSIEPSKLFIGASSKDASVLGKDAAGPASDAFLPPVGAGNGKDPHGEEVVSPGIHGAPPAPILAGEVSRDADAQEAKESEAAKAVLIDGQPVTEFENGPDWQGDENESIAGGEKQLSDPASVGLGPDAAGVSRPAGNASKGDWVEYAVSQGVAREDAEAQTRAEIIERFPEEG